MEMTVRMPANYNLMTADEMTYTTGGAWTDWYAGLNVAGDVVGAVMTGVMIVNWLGIPSTRPMTSSPTWRMASRPGSTTPVLRPGTLSAASPPPSPPSAAWCLLAVFLSPMA